MKMQSPPVFATEAAFGVFLASVAALLPGKWTAIPNPHPDHFRNDRSGQLRRDDGLTLDATADSYSARGKIVVGYRRPRDGKGESVTVYNDQRNTVHNPSIGCGETKTAEQIARDIERRLLADAEALHALVLARIVEADDYVSRHNAALLTVAQAAGLPDVPRDHYNKQPVFDLYVDAPNKIKGSGETLAKVEVRGPDCIHLIVDAKCGQAAALIAFLRSPAYLTA